MRFRLRDIMLLMLMVAIYLTTAIYVFRIDNESESLLASPLVGVIFSFLVFLIGFPGWMLLAHRWALRRARPIKVKLEVPISWKYLFSMLGFTVAFGIAAILLNFFIDLGSFQVIAAAGFIGASMPFLGTLLLIPSACWAHVGTGGVVWQSMYQRWSDVTVERGEDGLIESIVIFKPPLGSLGGPLAKFALPNRTAEVPPQCRHEITNLYERNTNWLTDLRVATPLPAKAQDEHA